MQRLFSLSFFTMLFSVYVFSQQIPPPKFSLKGGFYGSPVAIYISSEDSTGKIFYTTDGSEPKDSSIIYTSPVPINKTTVLRARIILSDSVYSDVKTATYFINENMALPVISISTDPKNLWDPKTGIYVAGDSAYYKGPNYGKDWERPIHFEFFESNGTFMFSMDAGVKIYGETSRDLPQKSLSILARKSYGYGKINYKFFPGLEIEEFESVVLRNSGNDWNNTMFRDGLMHSLLKNNNVDVLAYRPSVVFLNGEYWGIHNIREKPDEHYISSHHHVDADSLDIMRYWGIMPERGSYSEYSKFQQFASTADFTIKENYDSLKKIMDTDEFTAYVISQVFYDNTDWPANNVKCWRAWKPGGKWRWILWDTDYGFDFLNKETYKNQSLDFITGGKNPVFPDPGTATKIILNLLKNEEFKNNFINCFADFTNTIFKKDSLLSGINEIKKRIGPEIPRHFRRWNGDPEKWKDNVAIVEKFAINRLTYIRQNFIYKFNLKGLSELTLNVNNFSGGKIQVNTVAISRFPWKGDYFSGIPIKISAKPFPGYKFVMWLGTAQKNNNPVSIEMDSSQSITALFEPDSSFSNIVINEINYNGSKEFDSEDWVEIFNASGSGIALSDWVFKDEDNNHSFIIPNGVLLGQGGYLVLCQDTIKFSSLFPEVKNRIGNFDFGLNNGGELLRLFDQKNNLIDSLSYRDSTPWPTGADGGGKTLELKNPLLDNSQAINWSLSRNHGSPGKTNDNFTLTGPMKKHNFPERYLLLQNYPNPFNPITTIEYALPKESHIKIAVFDILGREIMELANNIQKEGWHSLTFNVGKVTSGIYFYFIEAEDLNGLVQFREVKKMMILK